MIGTPHARVLRLAYRDAQPKLAAETGVFEVTFRAPDGDVYTHGLDNRRWLVDNPALQFMALYDFRPSFFDGTSMDVEDHSWLLPVVYDDGEYKLSQTVLSGGESALRNAEWFNADDGEKLDSGPADASNSGGDSDPSGGADKTGEEDNVTAELTPEEDTGVEVTVE